MRFLLLWLILMIATTARAKSFQNAYASFDLPDNWHCGQEGVAWICTPSSAVDTREALIVITAKVAGPEDTLPSFMNYLNRPKSLATRGKLPTLSQPLGSNQIRVAGLEWVQSSHYASEVPGFNTTYLATVKDQLAVLLSFSSDQEKKQKYGPIFQRAIQTIKIDSSKQIQSTQSERPQGLIGQEVSVVTQPTVLAPITLHPNSSRNLYIMFGLVACSLLATAIVRKFF
jgi:hypothetical protein